MDPSRGIMSGNGFDNQIIACFNRMRNVRPGGTAGTGTFTPTYPYGVSPVKEYPYGSSSVGRQPWDGWRYGSGYTGPNPGQVYGEPDYKYVRHEYCGPNGCAPPGYMGDAFGKNPNVRYVTLDPRNILGSGVVPQNLEQPATATPSENGQTEEPEKPKEKGVKFQISFGVPSAPGQQRPLGQTDPSNNSNYELGPGGDQENGQMTTIKPRRAFNDPCGNCKACKSSKPRGLQNRPTLVRGQFVPPTREDRCAQSIGRLQPCQAQRGQRYPNCALLKQPGMGMKMSSRPRTISCTKK